MTKKVFWVALIHRRIWRRGERPHRMLGFTWREDDPDSDTALKAACEIARLWMEPTR